VDFLHTDRNTMQALLLNAVPITLHGFAVKVPALKDLIAMKIFSLSSSPASREGFA